MFEGEPVTVRNRSVKEEKGVVLYSVFHNIVV